MSHMPSPPDAALAPLLLFVLGCGCGSNGDAPFADAALADAGGSPTDSSFPDGDSASSDATVTIDAAELAVRRVFLSVGRWNGALGGLAGADAKCQAEADGEGLTGTFRAWLGDDTGSPATRFTRTGGPYMRLDGVAVAADWDDLVDGNLAASITVTAAGAPGDSVYDSWSNVNVDGTTEFALYDCDRWSVDGDASGALGIPTYTDFRWTRGSAPGLVTSCFFEKHLYCFEE
jgi:hypothetical protein